MVLVSDPHTVLVEAQRLCNENAAAISGSVRTLSDARLFAKKLLADVSLRSTEPLGVALLRMKPAAQGGPGLELLASMMPQAEALAENSPVSAAAPAAKNATEQLLRQQGPSSKLLECPYCTEPWRRFCPECGRRHETQSEKSIRLWRTMFRQLQFSGKIASAARLEKPNTCAEEFYVELA